MDKRTIATKAILQQAAAVENGVALQAMLTDWFHRTDLELWQQKWHYDTDRDVTKALSQHAAWMDDAQIAFTPTFFINGRRLPGRYNLKDIEKLVPQLAGQFAVQAQ